ncbi:MAG: EamA family transporter [Lachnospiraceae bacterium]|nr:EamA family transporter [Lachnospiraceae bacterium]
MMGIYIVLFLLSVLISSVSQIILKTSADRQYESKIKEYLNFRVIAAYGIFFVSSVMTILAYNGVPLSMGAVLETTGYLWVTLLGHLILKEKITICKIIGLVIIMLGVMISGMG